METRVTVPDRTDPIVAWRVWGITEDPDAPLASVSQQGIRWVPGERLERKCLCGGVGVPFNGNGHVEEHSCGIHGALNLSDALGYYQSNLTGFGSVLGRVSLWGRVTVHENGIYRAEFAYPKAFCVSANDGAHRRLIVRGLASLYGVEAERVELPYPYSCGYGQAICQCERCQMQRHWQGQQWQIPAPVQVQAPYLGPSANPYIITQPVLGWPQTMGVTQDYQNLVWNVGNQSGGV